VAVAAAPKVDLLRYLMADAELPLPGKRIALRSDAEAASV
jgi:hypothetical protein